LKIRVAKESDKEEILHFCINTFSWGDYVDRVWDNWYRNGRLLVVEDRGRRIGMSHVTMCPNNKNVWLEGVRVHPDYRHSGIATELVEKMIQYGRQRGIQEASAIVDAGNLPSQRMMEKNGFEIISKWAYYSTGERLKRKKSTARLGTIGEMDDIWQYLQDSRIYSLSAKRYVKSWHWYALDRKVLLNLIKEDGVILVGRPISGVAIINQRGYWDRKNIMQIVYLDAASKGSVANLVSFVTNLYLDGEFEELQLLCHDSVLHQTIIEGFMAKDEEQFFLYNKVFTPNSFSLK
jgi:N-acetylglutamate synthase-like GNAT family acetyltransferase